MPCACSKRLAVESLSLSLSHARALNLTLAPSLSLSRYCFPLSLSQTHLHESQAVASRAKPIVASPRGAACTNKLINPRSRTPGEELRPVLRACTRKSSHATCTPGVKHRPQGQLHLRVLGIMKRFRGGLVFKAHKLLHNSNLGSRVKKMKREVGILGVGFRPARKAPATRAFGGICTPPLR